MGLENGSLHAGPYDFSDSIWNYPAIRTLPIMQFTGLRDKNNVEIYEGDVVRTPSGNICEIKWDTVVEEWRGEVFKYTGFALRNIKHNTLYHFDHAESFDVIGNIYSNPELLK